MTKKRIGASTLFSLSLIFIFNPNINLIDPLPDFIGYLMMMLAIGAASNTVPYLAECKSAIGVLAPVSAARIPSFIIMYRNLGTGRDIVPMFTLIFAAIECILLYKAMKNGYAALAYIAERTDASTVTEPFTINKRGKKMSVPSLRMLTYIFLLSRQLLNLSPELLLLTTEDAQTRRQLREAYPTMLVICIFAALIIGVIWLVRAEKFVKHLSRTSNIGEAVSELDVKGEPEEEASKSHAKSILFSLTILAVSSIFSFDLVFSDFENINILPHFIYGLVLFCALFNMTSDKRKRTFLSLATGAFTAFSIAAQMYLSRFLQQYEYLLLLYSSKARSMYLPVKTFAVFEALALLALLGVSVMIFADFIKENTGTSPSDEAHGRLAEKHHRSLILRSSVLFSLSGIIGLLKCLNVFLKGNVRMEFSEISNEGFATGALPWMGTLIFALCVILVLYSFYFIHDVKDEVNFKYGVEK